MTDAPNSSAYILASADSVDLPNSRTITASGGILKQDTGAGGTMNFTTTGNLATLNDYSDAQPGLIVWDATTHGFVSVDLDAGTGITIAKPQGQGGNPIISVTPSSTVQFTNVQAGGVPTSSHASTTNYVGTGSTSVTALYNGGINTVTIDVPTGAADDATYIVQTPTDAPPNSQKLSALATGILKSTTATGVVSIAVSGTDYLAPSANLTSISAITPTVGTLPIGNGTGFSAFLPSANIGSVFTSGGTAADPEWIPGDAAGKVFTSTGLNSQPTWQAPGIASGAIVLPTSTTSQTFTANNAYIPTASSTVTFSLPVTLVPGDSYEIIGYGSGGWTILISGGRTITIGDQVPATTSVSSILATDSIIIFCVDATHLVANIYSGQLNLS